MSNAMAKQRSTKSVQADDQRAPRVMRRLVAAFEDAANAVGYHSVPENILEACDQLVESGTETCRVVA
jgi:hypothetical protein